MNNRLEHSPILQDLFTKLVKDINNNCIQSALLIDRVWEDKNFVEASTIFMTLIDALSAVQAKICLEFIDSFTPNATDTPIIIENKIRGRVKSSFDHYMNQPKEESENAMR